MTISVQEKSSVEEAYKCLLQKKSKQQGKLFYTGARGSVLVEYEC